MTSLRSFLFRDDFSYSQFLNFCSYFWKFFNLLLVLYSLKCFCSPVIDSTVFCLNSEIWLCCRKSFSRLVSCAKQRPDQYEMKILVFSIQYDFQILKYRYQYSIWRILNKYQYAEKTEVSVFSISILSGRKYEKTSKPSRFEKLRWT